MQPISDVDPDFAEHMAEYAARIAERFRGHIRWYTPLNEPRIAAWYAGRLGWWPPYRRSWRGFGLRRRRSDVDRGRSDVRT